jgi:hypothetical protein
VQEGAGLAQGQPGRTSINAADKAKDGGSGGAAVAVDRTPIAGFDVAKLEPAKQDLFFKLVGELPSPCGKAHSLRTSFASDGSCKRAPFAVRLVHDLIVDEQTEDTSARSTTRATSRTARRSRSTWSTRRRWARPTRR